MIKIKEIFHSDWKHKLNTPVSIRLAAINQDVLVVKSKANYPSLSIKNCQEESNEKRNNEIRPVGLLDEIKYLMLST